MVKKILFVTQDLDSVVALQHVLTSEISVAQVTNKNNCFKLLKKEAIRLIVFDYKMAGFEITEYLNQLNNTNMPLLIIDIKADFMGKLIESIIQKNQSSAILNYPGKIDYYPAPIINNKEIKDKVYRLIN